PLGGFEIFRGRGNNALALWHGLLQPPDSLDMVTFILFLHPFRVRVAFAGLASRTKPAFRGTFEICLEQLRIGVHTSYHSHVQSPLRILSVNFVIPAPSAALAVGAIKRAARGL